MHTLPSRQFFKSLGIEIAQMSTCPQGQPVWQTCPLSANTADAYLHTAFNTRQVLDKKGENAAVHSEQLPLSTTTNLN
jgi:hypothetical protein